MKIRIEQKHIDNSSQADSKRCALASATKEQTGLQISCYEKVTIKNLIGGWKTVCELNSLAQAWIKRFDRDKNSVQPTVIDVPILDDLCIRRSQLMQAQAEELGAVDSAIIRERNKVSVLVSLLPE